MAVEKAVAPAWSTVRADFPYRKEGRRAPDRPPKLLAAVREELAAIRSRRVVVGGRSMGGRMCSMVAAGADGEPLPSGSPASWRSRTRCTRPARPTTCASSTCPGSPCRACSCTAPVTRSARPPSSSEWTGTIPGAVTHHWIDGGGHDLKGADREVAAAVADWLTALG